MIRVLPFLLLVFGCSELATVERLRCGNGLQELQAGEDCDGLPAGSPLRCGEPGTPAACQYVCDDAPCPAGWSCGGDAICRAGTGRLGPPAILTVPGHEVSVGDFDGDGRQDVVAQDYAAVYVAFGEGDGSLGEVVSADFTTNLTPVAVGDIDQDGRDDLIVHTSDGAVIYPGRADRQLVALATPIDHPKGTPELAVAVRARAPFPASQQLLVGWRDASGLRLELDGEPVDLGTLDLFERDQVIGHVAVANVDGERNGDELALATEGGDRVEIVRITCSPCRVQRIATVLAPRDSKIIGGTFFSDLDGDGDRDLIVSTEQERGRQVAIAWREGGGFGLMTLQLNLRMVLAHPAMAPPGDVPILKAVADVIGDDRPELITDQAVFRLEGEGAVQAGRIVVGQPADLVLPADFDGDGRSELVVAAPGELRLYAFGEIDGFGATTLPVGAVDDVVVGDFDADGRDDFVFTTGVDGSIMGSFSSRDPMTLQLVADLDPPATALAVLRGSAGDSIEPATFFSLADGARYRFQGRYLGLPATPIELPGRGRSAAIGRFFDGEQGALIGSRGLAGRDTFLFGLAGAELGVNPPHELPDPCSTPSAFFTLSRTVDFDGDGHDTLLQLNTGASDLNRPGGTAPGQELMAMEQSWPIYLADLVDGDVRCRWSGEVTAEKVPVQLEVADLDGDGHDDIAALLLFRSSGDQRTRRPGDAILAVWRGTAGDPEPSVQYALPYGTVGAAAMRLAGGRQALALSTPDQTLMAWIADGQLITDVLGDGTPGVQGSTAGDLDGDGLDDLVIKTSTSIVVRRQEACSARDAWEGRCRRP